MVARLLFSTVAFLIVFPLVSRSGDECLRSYLDLRRLVGSEDYEGAFERSVQLLNVYPEFPPLYEAVAELGLYTRNWERSEEFLAGRIRQGIEVPLALYGYAISLASRDDHTGAIQCCMEAIERGLTYSGVYKELAYAHEKAYGDDEALSMLGRLSRRFPRSAGYHYAVAVELWNLGDFRPVVARLKEAVALDPAQPRYADALAVADLRLAYSRRKAEHVEARRTFASLRGDIPGAQFMVSSLLSEQIYAGDHRRRDTLLQESTAEASEYGFLRWLGWNLQKRADVEALASNYSIARGYALVAKQLALRCRESDLQSVAVKRICGTFFEEGRFDSALCYARIWQSEAARGHRKQEYVSSLGRMAQIYHALGQDQLALEYAIESIAQADMSTIDPGTLAEIEIIFGEVQESIGNLASALAHLERAAAILKNSSTMPYAIAATLGNLGQLALRKKELRKAGVLLEAQLKILRSLDYPAELASALLSWGDYFFALRRFEKAKSQYYASLELASKVTNWKLEFDALRKVALAETALGNDSLAHRAFNSLDSVARHARENGSLDFPIFISTLKEKAFEEFRRGRINDGIGTLETMRYLELESYWQTSFNRLRVPSSRAPSSSAIESIKGLVFAYDMLRQQSECTLANPTSRFAQLSAMESVYDARLAVSRISEALISSKPRVLQWSAQYVDPIRALTAYLKRSPSLVVQYLVNETKVTAVVATPETTMCVILPATTDEIRSEFLAFSRMFRSASVSAGILHPSMVAFDYIAGHKLYCQLIEPILKAAGRYSRLVVITDGFLRNLPFEALVVRLNKYSESPTFLVEDFEVSYCLSLGQLGEIGGRKEDVSSVLLCGNANRKTSNLWSPRRTPMMNIMDLDAESSPELPAAHNELGAIRSLLDPLAEMLEGEEATRENVIRKIHRYDVIHIASHTSFDTKTADFSSFLLSSKQGDPSRGNLAINDLRLVECNAKLVVLSGCNTARVPDSGSVLSLAIAFNVIGAEAVVGSLWESQDDNARQLMTDFYRALAMGASVSSALRTAKVMLIHSGKTDPFFWANFVFCGYPDTLPNGMTQMGRIQWDFGRLSILIIGPMVNFIGMFLAFCLITKRSVG